MSIAAVHIVAKDQETCVGEPEPYRLSPPSGLHIPAGAMTNHPTTPLASTHT